MAAAPVEEAAEEEDEEHQIQPMVQKGHLTSQSRDMQDGGHQNYRQSQDGTLHKSPHGHPLCNYCGIPSHKREKCTIKAADREAGLTRVYHPDRDKAVSNHDKAKVATSAAAKEISNAIMSSSAMPPNPPMQYQWSYPWMAPPFQGESTHGNTLKQDKMIDVTRGRSLG